MMHKITWADWWASRTIRFNTVMGSLYTAIIPVILAVDETTLTTLGASPKNIIIAMAAIKILDSYAGNKLRAVTDKPLAGRDDVPASRILK